MCSNPSAAPCSALKVETSATTSPLSRTVVDNRAFLLALVFALVSLLRHKRGTL